MHTCCHNASANCMLAYMLLHRGICTFGALLQQLVQCILATITLCCYNPWFCCLHAIIVLLLACFSYAACTDASMVLQFCCLHVSIVLLLPCFHSSATSMLPWFCYLHATMVLLLACFHGSAAGLHASLILF